VAGSSYAYSSGRVSGLEGSLLSRRIWHQLLSAEDSEEVLKVLGETWYGGILQGGGDLQKALRTAVSMAEDELNELSDDRMFKDGILQRRDVRNARYLWKDLAFGGEGQVDTETPGTIAVEKLVKAWSDDAEADSLPGLFKKTLEALQLMNNPTASVMDTEMDRLAAAVEADNLGKMQEPLKSLPLVRIELRNFLTSARCRGESLGTAELEGILLPGGYHSPSEVAESSRMNRLSSSLSENAGFENAAPALEEGIETGSFISYQRESDSMILELLDRASSEMFTPGPLAAYVLRRELEVSHLKLITAGKAAGIDSRRLSARIPRG